MLCIADCRVTLWKMTLRVECFSSLIPDISELRKPDPVTQKNYVLDVFFLSHVSNPHTTYICPLFSMQVLIKHVMKV